MFMLLPVWVMCGAIPVGGPLVFVVCEKMGLNR